MNTDGFTVAKQTLLGAAPSTLLWPLIIGLFIHVQAAAELPRYSVHLGIRGGGHLTLDDFQISERDPELQFEHGGIIGMTVGGYPVYWFGLEATVDVLMSETQTRQLNTSLLIGGDALITFSTANFSPHFSAGGGVYLDVTDSAGAVHAPFGRWGVGLRGRLHRFVILRLDVRHLITRGVDEAAHNMTGTIGLDFVLFDDTSPDSDQDGVVDAFDACPKVYGEESLGGCPDADGDGVPDHRDRCQDSPGPKAHRLCIFGRAATLTDVRERCAQIIALGCPDTDDDGLADTLDRCPTHAGPRWMQGCPDGDGDAVADKDDQCPLRAGPSDRQGCPDTDDDGVIDDDDKCRRTPGSKKNHGCPLDDQTAPLPSTPLNSESEPPKAPADADSKADERKTTIPDAPRQHNGIQPLGEEDESATAPEPNPEPSPVPEPAD